MSEKIECIHCGEDCGRSPIVWEGKNFCCEGCKTVYQLLNENKLSGYYDIYETPGIKVVILYPSGKVSFLQEQQLTTLGHNIEAIEVNGTFKNSWNKYILIVTL